MAATSLMKYTYHRPNGRNFHSYLKMPSPTFAILKREIMMSLFEQHDLEYAELRVYWIDDDLDEIEIVNQNDYEVFRLKRPDSQHLHVAAIYVDNKDVNVGADITVTPTAEAEVQTGTACQAVHSNIECDSCLASPIVGFRYKCLNCPNYDLCEGCEAKHHHPGHIMVRLPYPSLNLDHVLRGRCGGKRHKRMSNSCPMMNNPIPVPVDCAPNCSGPTDGGKERHHRRKLREYRNSFFSNLYNIMQDLAEGGTNAQAKHDTADQNEEKTDQSSNEKNNGSDEKVQKKSENVAKNNADIQFANEASAFAANAANIAQKNAELAKKVLEVASGVGSVPNMDIDALAGAAKKHQLETETFASAIGNNSDENIKPKEESKNKVESNASPETKEKDSAHPEIDLSNINLEQVSQLVGPPLMKTGFEILNNLSDMFAKILDPTGEADPSIAASVLGSLSSLSPDSTSESRKNSVASQFSVASQNSTTQTECMEKVVSTKVPTATTSTTTTPDSSVNVESLEKISGLHRNSSDDNDWQIIDKQHAASAISPEAAAVPMDVTAQNSVEAQVVSKSVDNGATGKPIENANVIEEQPKVNATEPNGIGAAIGTPSLPAPHELAYTSPYAQLSTAIGSAMASQEISSNSSGAIPKNSNATPVVFHQNPKINRAVIAMMAMGFSNEGAWLTQLLDSVDGNIATALDLMNTTQRNSN